VYGCEFCADADNRAYGHLDQVCGEDGGVVLLRCPRCQSLYRPSDNGGDAVAVTPEEAATVLPPLRWTVIPGGPVRSE
jgi:hypothetical protein